MRLPIFPLSQLAKHMPVNLDIKTTQSPNQAFAWWLVHCYLYYIADQPLLSDKDFDTLTGWLKASWSSVTHEHKHLVTMEDLNAGSGFAIKYPLRVEIAAWQLLRDHAEKEPAKNLGKRPASTKVTAPSTPPKRDSLFDLI